MTVIGFDPVIAIRARPLPTMLPHAVLDLQFSNRRRITSQAVSGKHVWRWIVRIGHRSSQEQLGGFAIARLRQVEIYGLALAVHRAEKVHLFTGDSNERLVHVPRREFPLYFTAKPPQHF